MSEVLNNPRKETSSKGTRKRKRSKAGYISDSMKNLSDSPLWVLNVDYDFFSRKLEIVRSRRKKGEPAHKRYPTYELGLKERLFRLEAEIERRKEKGSQ